MPHLGSGITWNYQGKQVFASLNIKEGKITVIDMETWQVIKEIKTEGPGFFMRSHTNSPYAWTDVFFGPNNEKVHVIDKSTLEIVKLIPMKKPSGKYNVFNKISYEKGTSH